MEKAIIGFIGAGGIARAHAFSLNSLPYFYNDAPETELGAVTSATVETRTAFARKYAFEKACSLVEFLGVKKINTVFILGPNKVHYEHFRSVVETMPQVKNIYIEKPVCSNAYEEIEIDALARKNPGIRIQVGFQFIFSSAIREMIILWKSGIFGKPVHFELKYYHSDYLSREYRDKRVTRLTPAPDGGAMADLGSHSISLLVAMLGDNLKITSAMQSGHFEDVTDESDLFSSISLYDEASHAAGTISASRISAGTGDYFYFEMFAEDGSLKYNSENPDSFEFFTSKSRSWSRKMTGSRYNHFSSFPSGHVPPGWLRSMIHAHYVFLTGKDNQSFIPGIKHGLMVQSLVTETAKQLKQFRKSIQ